MAKENQKYYTPERLVEDCRLAIEKYGRVVSLTYVHQDEKTGIDQKYHPPSYKLHSLGWANITHKSSTKTDYCWLDGDGSGAAAARILFEIVDSDAPCNASFIDAVIIFAELASKYATKRPYYICPRTGDDLVLASIPRFDIDETDCTEKEMIACLEHLDKYQDKQWIMVWDDVLGAIQMAALTLVEEERQGGMSPRKPAKPVAIPMGWTQKDLIECVDGEFSEKTFTRIRKDAKIKPSESVTCPH